MDVEYIVRFTIGFVIGVLTARHLISPAMKWAWNKWSGRTPHFIDVTEKLVAGGAPELPNNLKYMYDSKEDSVDINFNGTCYFVRVGTIDNANDVPIAMVGAAKKAYRKFLPAFTAEQKRLSKLEFVKSKDSGSMKVLGERRAWVDDAS